MPSALKNLKNFKRARVFLLVSFLVIFSLYLLPLRALASLSYEIPYTLDNNQNGLILCDIPPYNNVIHFRSYRIGKSGPGSSLLNGTTFGNGVCTGSLNASLGPGGNFDPANGQGLDGTPGIYYVTLYLGSNYTDPYGYMAFNCTLSSCTPHRETPLPEGFLHWGSFSITNPTPPISISCSNSSEPRYLMTKENFDLISPDYVYDATNENLHIINGNPLCTGTLTITEEPTGDYVFFGGSDIGANRIIIERVQFLHFDTDTDTLSIPNTTPTCTTDCFSNVLFLPGIQGSRLYDRRENGTEDQLWEPNGNADVEDLYLNPDGTSANPNIYTKDIIDRTNISLSIFDQDIYKSFEYKMDELVAQGKINEWQSFAYDWRQAVDDIAENGTKYENEIKKLEDVLTALSANSKNEGKVTMIAHSNGGLLAKAFLKYLQDKKTAGTSDLIDKVDVLVLVAVPQIGSADAVNVLLHGMNLVGGILMDKEHSRLLGNNMLGAYGLLPSREYINRVSASPVTFKDTTIPSGVMDSYINNYGNVIDSYEEYKSFLFGVEGRADPVSSDILAPDILSASLFLKSENLHNILDFWTPPSTMRVIEIAGWGIDTLAGMEYYPKRECLSLNDCKYILDHKPIFTIDGDKTVVDVSAHYINSGSNVEKYWLDLIGYNIQNPDKVHETILEASSILDFVYNLIQNRNETPSFISSIKPTATSNRLRINIQSPVSLDAYDTYGNHTGKVCPEGSDFCFVEENISNSSYLEIGEGKYINIPEDNFDKVTLQGTGIGTFTYESEKVLPDGTSTVSSFIDIPVTIETKAEITLDTNQKPELKLDITGDGDFEFTISSGEEFDPILYLEIMKETVDSLDILKSKKNALKKRIESVIKAIEKGKIAKAELKAEKFKMSLEKKIDKLDPRKPKHKKLTDTDAQILVDMLEKLLDNLE